MKKIEAINFNVTGIMCDVSERDLIFPEKEEIWVRDQIMSERNKK